MEVIRWSLCWWGAVFNSHMAVMKFLPEKSLKRFCLNSTHNFFICFWIYSLVNTRDINRNLGLICRWIVMSELIFFYDNQCLYLSSVNNILCLNCCLVVVYSIVSRYLILTIAGN